MFYLFFFQACELTKILNLKENFNIYDFLVPLFLQDKLNVIDEFLLDNNDYQIAFLEFLDSLILEKNLSERISKLIRFVYQFFFHIYYKFGVFFFIRLQLNLIIRYCSYFFSDLKMPDIPINTLCKLYNVKSLNRYIKRLISVYNITKDVVPNFSKRSDQKTLSYYVHKRFIDKSLSE